MKQIQKVLILGIMLVLSCGPAMADNPDVLTREEMANIDAVLVPSPSELFLALSKMGDYDWSRVVTNNRNTNYKNDHLRSLNLGTRGADGFLAIQSEDGKQLGELTTTIMRLARDLAVDEPIVAQGSELRELALQKKWADVRSHLDTLRNDLEHYIDSLGDKENAMLVSAGGWLKGLNAVSQLLKDQYNEKASMILYQPDLVQYYIDQIDGIREQAAKTPVIAEIAEALPDIKKLIDVGRGRPIPNENIEKLYQISSKLVQAIERG